MGVEITIFIRSHETWYPMKTWYHFNLLKLHKVGTWRKWYFQKDSYWCYVWFTPSRRVHMVWRVSHTLKWMNEWMVKHLISQFEQCLLTTLSMQFEKQLWDHFLGCWIGILFGCIIKVQSPLNLWACFGWLWFDCT